MSYLGPHGGEGRFSLALGRKDGLSAPHSGQAICAQVGHAVDGKRGSISATSSGRRLQSSEIPKASLYS
jgi:hypothetical protein